MHILRDENGNLIPHGEGHTHEHEHCHEQTHEHDHEHCHEHTHEHDHEHCHEHDHEHSHEHGHKNLAILTYMCDHNAHHAEEIEQMLAQMGDTLPADAVEKIRAAVADFKAGNEKLAEAIKIIG